MAGSVVEISGLITHSGQIWLVTNPADMRRGIDGLSLLVQQALGHSPCAGAAFIFRNRTGNRIKVLVWDGTGVWLCQRRLHQGRFIWLESEEGCIELTPLQWAWLTAGVDWQRLSALPPAQLRV